MKRLERLSGIDRELTDLEKEQGEALRQSLLALHGSMFDARVDQVGVDLSTGFGLEQDGTRLVALPNWFLPRTLEGIRTDGSGDYSHFTPRRGRTRVPFVLEKARASVGYDAHATDPSVVMVRGKSGQWIEGDRWDRRELHYSYEFDLAKHGLAIMGIERPATNE